jgi:Raf kinase inhibitor-like YbhB/YbcL family protein
MLELRSSAFQHEGTIPARHTCQGPDLSPPLEWSGAPPGTRSFALIVDDPDAPDPAKPRLVWVHWLLYNLPASLHSLTEGAGNHATAPIGEHALTNDDSLGYHGPCPPIGRHRYYFRLFALDQELPSLGPTARRPDLERAMAGHILGTAVLMGTYQQT